MVDEDDAPEVKEIVEYISDKVNVKHTLTRAFRICYRNPGTFLGMAALVALPSFVAELLGMMVHAEVMSGLGQGLVGIFSFILWITAFVLIIFYTGAIPVLTSFSLDYRPMAWTDAFSWVRKRKLFWGIFGVSLLAGLAFLGGLILLIIPGLLFYVWFLLAVPARVLGDFPGRQALSESRRLIRPVLFRGAAGLAAVILLMSFVLSLTVSGITWVIWGYGSSASPKVLITSIFSYCHMVFWNPVAGVALAIAYIELSGGLSSLRKDLFL